jgi:hypothetical protein
MVRKLIPNIFVPRKLLTVEEYLDDSKKIKYTNELKI